MELLVAASLFVLSHVLIARSRIKTVFVARFGHGFYMAAYSLLSLVLMAWMLAAFLELPRTDLWPTPVWAYGFAIAASYLAFLLIGTGLATPNPLSVSLRKSAYRPERPGITGGLRHSVLWGFALWGMAHLPANGDVESVLLFGGIIGFALLGARGLDRRYQKRLGMDQWQAMRSRPLRPDRNAAIGAIAGSLAWLVFLAAHPLLFGYDPWSAFMM